MRLADRLSAVPRPRIAGRGPRSVGLALLAGCVLLAPPGAVCATEPGAVAPGAGTEAGAVPEEAGGVPGAAGTRTLYRWKDERGTTHYSDRPRPGAERIVVQGSSGVRGTATPRFVPAAVGGRGAGTPAGPVYTSVAVVRPTQDHVFVNDPLPIELVAAVAPALRTGHQLWFYVDGQRVAGRSPAEPGTSVQLLRGTHTVLARIVDETGTTVASSAPVTFHVRQTSIAQPPVGPLLRRPPSGAPNRPGPPPAPRP